MPFLSVPRLSDETFNHAYFVTASNRCGDPAPESAARDLLVPLKLQRPWMKLRASTPGLTKKTKTAQVQSISLSALGRKELYDQIDDMSVEAAGQQLEWMAATVRELQSNSTMRRWILKQKPPTTFGYINMSKPEIAFSSTHRNMSLSR